MKSETSNVSAVTVQRWCLRRPIRSLPNPVHCFATAYALHATHQPTHERAQQLHTASHGHAPGKSAPAILALTPEDEVSPAKSAAMPAGRTDVQALHLDLAGVVSHWLSENLACGIDCLQPAQTRVRVTTFTVSVGLRVNLKQNAWTEKIRITALFNPRAQGDIQKQKENPQFFPRGMSRETLLENA